MFATPLAVAEGFRRAWGHASAAELTEVFAADADFVNVLGFWWRGVRTRSSLNEREGVS